MVLESVKVPSPCFTKLAALLPLLEITPVTDPVPALLIVRAPAAAIFAAVKPAVLTVNAPLAVTAPLKVTELGAYADPTKLMA